MMPSSSQGGGVRIVVVIEGLEYVLSVAAQSGNLDLFREALAARGAGVEVDSYTLKALGVSAAKVLKEQTDLTRADYRHLLTRIEEAGANP